MKTKKNFPATIREARLRQAHNKQIFDKSYFGIKKQRMNTPDRPLNPPEDETKCHCQDCNGKGEIIDPEYYEFLADNPGEKPEPDWIIDCPTCEGEGVLPNDYYAEW